ncbi:diguanylate cyclase [Desulfosporosinus fructosivorans]|uniref:Stage 0 sporulation protein A homolog n=1 Tax=Desulfosporosinus fructosivorans TaxID=2018669 RepID=A0A4Z0R703_9FIRM|nr:HD domain-containing protein [Desulfosporosinus fructosivorans]TGE38568.1 diguanylate cyclase [Desulfosporosinus fructosivorans]
MTRNIMIIDDSPLDRTFIRKVLEMRLNDINVFEAQDGLNITDKLVSNKIHLCILDIMMPLKDGFQVLLEMKQDPAVVDIPVIVCTGIGDKQAIEKALTLGAYDYFSKPLCEEAMKTSLPLKAKNAIELMKRNLEISYLSYHDFLTELYNRRFCEEEIKRINTFRNLPISIIVGDINGLKLINDTFGHDEGDKLLKKAATTIQNACRIDDIIARWGGDEFIILLPKTKKEEAEEVVNRIKNLYAEEQVNGIQGSISFGWDTKHTMDEEITKIFKNAEDYMYRNKTCENESVRSRMINTIINTLHEKSPREEMHSKRVSELCQDIGKEIGLSESEIRTLKVGGLLHDIGKIAIEERILNKREKLTDKEWNEVRRHPEIGYRILSSSHEMQELADYVLAHHEKWDGTGYPKGLKGEAIPRVARIITLADSYDAMTNERPYRRALSEERVINEIRKNAGLQFDPEIAKLFVEKVLDIPWLII